MQAAFTFCRCGHAHINHREDGCRSVSGPGRAKWEELERCGCTEFKPVGQELRRRRRRAKK